MIIFNVNNLRSFATLISLHAGGWMVEKAAISTLMRSPSWIRAARSGARLGLGRVEVRQGDRGEGGGERREFLWFLSLSLSFSLPPFLSIFLFLSLSPSPRSLCRPSTRPRPSRANPRWRLQYKFRLFRPSNRLRAGCATPLEL